MLTRGRSAQPKATAAIDAKASKWHAIPWTSSKPRSAPAKPSSRSRTRSRTRVSVKRLAPPDTSHDRPPPPKRARVATRPPRSESSGRTPALLSSLPKPKEEASVSLLPLPEVPERGNPSAEVFVWGNGDCGQFGMGPEDESMGERTKPTRNKSMEETMKARIVAIAAGGMHSLFIDEDGKIWTCGLNDDAALGRITGGAEDDLEDLSTYPHCLDINEDYRAARIAAGDSISAAISTTGKLLVWGSFRVCPLCLPKPVHVLPSEPCVALAAGNNHLVVLTTAGAVYTWGASEQGQLGRTALPDSATTPGHVVLGARAVAVGAGAYHSFAVDDAGVVWGWV